MTVNSVPPIRLHEDPELFREAVNYTAACTGFVARLIEKDYFCSIVLQHLASVSNLVFRGGTCLSKVHSDFYRLSEDLDFVIPVPVELTRRERGRRAAEVKAILTRIGTDLPGLEQGAGARVRSMGPKSVAWDPIRGRSPGQRAG